MNRNQTIHRSPRRRAFLSAPVAAESVQLQPDEAQRGSRRRDGIRERKNGKERDKTEKESFDVSTSISDERSFFFFFRFTFQPERPQLLPAPKIMPPAMNTRTNRQGATAAAAGAVSALPVQNEASSFRGLCRRQLLSSPSTHPPLSSLSVALFPFPPKLQNAAPGGAAASLASGTSPASPQMPPPSLKEQAAIAAAKTAAKEKEKKNTKDKENTKKEQEKENGGGGGEGHAAAASAAASAAAATAKKKAAASSKGKRKASSLQEGGDGGAPLATSAAADNNNNGKKAKKGPTAAQRQQQQQEQELAVLRSALASVLRALARAEAAAEAASASAARCLRAAAAAPGLEKREALSSFSFPLPFGDASERERDGIARRSSAPAALAFLAKGQKDMEAEEKENE